MGIPRLSKVYSFNTFLWRTYYVPHAHSRNNLQKKKVDQVLADTEAIFWVEGGQIINKSKYDVKAKN